MTLILLLSLFLHPHDFHVTTAHVAVENNVLVCRIRFFTDDLEDTLSHFHHREGLKMAQSREIEALFAAYFDQRFTISAGGSALKGRIIDSGEDLSDREPVWYYTLQFEAPEPIHSVRVHNTLLFDLFTDQQNVFKVIHYPDETQRSYYFTVGEDTAEIGF